MLVAGLTPVEQIVSVVPYTLLAINQVFLLLAAASECHTFLYQALRNLGADDSLRQFVKDVFGRGWKLGNCLILVGLYDGQN